MSYTQNISIFTKLLFWHPHPWDRGFTSHWQFYCLSFTWCLSSFNTIRFWILFWKRTHSTKHCWCLFIWSQLSLTSNFISKSLMMRLWWGVYFKNLCLTFLFWGHFWLYSSNIGKLWQSISYFYSFRISNS